MNALRWLGGLALTMLVGPAFGADRLKINVPEVEVRSGPTSAYYPTSKLRQGDEVDILGVEEGMLKIAPPQGSFDWVSAADVEVSATVATVFKATELRRGSAIDTDKNINVMAPTKLEPGTLLSILPGPPQMAGKEMLIKVRPPNNDVRYIPKDAVSLPPGGLAPSTAASVAKIPGYGNESPPPSFGPVTVPNNQANSLVGPYTQPSAPPSFQMPAAQSTAAPAFGAQSPPPVLPASYNPPQDNRGSEILPPAFQNGSGRQAGRNSATPTVPNYSTSATSISRGTQMTASLTDDPDWVEGEKLEEFYAQSKNLNDIKTAISHYDAVGKKYGQSDPTLALRAMNRAQYLRNAISAGVIQQTGVSRSAKPSNFGDTATTEAYPSSAGRSNIESRQTRGKTAHSDVYAETPKYLPPEPAAPPRTSNNTIDVSQPSAKLDKPLQRNETPPTGAQTVTCAGMLESTPIVQNGKKFYRLTPDNQNIAKFIYCTNLPSVNLEDGLNRHVELTGLFYLHKSVGQYYIEVLQYTILPSKHQ